MTHSITRESHEDCSEGFANKRQPVGRNGGRVSIKREHGFKVDKRHCLHKPSATLLLTGAPGDVGP